MTEFSSSSSSSSSSQTPRSGNIVTFVQEGATHAVNFLEEPHRKLAAINVAQCHILEIANRDAENKRTVMSLSHFMVPHLMYERNLNVSVRTVLDNFVAQGGNLETAQFRIYGGVEGQNRELRDNLIGAISKIHPTAIIEQPRGHEVKRMESIDYLFDRAGITFRKAVVSENEYDDEVSGNLKEKGKLDKGKVDRHQAFMGEQWANVRRAIESQTRVIEGDLSRGKEILRNVSDSLEAVAEEDPRKISVLVGIIESQVAPMSLKVCDKNGLVARQQEGVKASSATKLGGGRDQHTL